MTFSPKEKKDLSKLPLSINPSAAIIFYHVNPPPLSPPTISPSPLNKTKEFQNEKIYGHMRIFTANMQYQKRSSYS